MNGYRILLDCSVQVPALSGGGDSVDTTITVEISSKLQQMLTERWLNGILFAEFMQLSIAGVHISIQVLCNTCLRGLLFKMLISSTTQLYCYF